MSSWVPVLFFISVFPCIVVLRQEIFNVAENEVIVTNACHSNHSMFRGCMLILFAYIWFKAFKKKNWFSVLIKTLLSKLGE